MRLAHGERRIARSVVGCGVGDGMIRARRDDEATRDGCQARDGVDGLISHDGGAKRKRVRLNLSGMLAGGVGVWVGTNLHQRDCGKN